ncbi:S8 family peptidase [Chryseobacterium sp.]|uniref:S8 family peptidase n=1 Tax=Chryseobacterium sp. TaxID=1871047 RepID=UPI00388F3F97
MMKKLLLFCLFANYSMGYAQSELVFVFFKDKPNKGNFYANPLSELSQKSLDRRSTQGITLNDQDAPIEPSYISTIQNLGFTVTDHSKWLNGVILNLNQAQANIIKSLPFVHSLESFAKNTTLVLKTQNVNKWENYAKENNSTTLFNYGNGTEQIDQINLRPLHLANYTGTGISIAVIDTGFPTVNIGSAFSRLISNNQIKGGYDFVSKSTDIYDPTLNSHGTLVLGAIGGFIQDTFVGSAPDANFYLYRSEDADVEIPEEEIYWIEAAEEADRKGVDIITSSLGYSTFDDARYNYSYAQMNGTTSFIARGSEIASSKGIFVLAATGNSGAQPWHYLLTPADNAQVFTVRAVDDLGNPSNFSSFGPNSSGIIKPDGATRGTSATTVINNTITSVSGTSIATPIAAGGIACLMQAFPSLNRNQMKTRLCQTASLYPNTNNQIGYGILNFGNFYNTVLSSSELVKKETIALFPNPTSSILNIATEKEVVTVEVYDNLGKLLFTEKKQKSIKVEDFPIGTYYLKIQTQDNIYYEKFMKK